MSYRQLVDANMNTGYKGGWCLKFVQDAFGTDHPYPSAIDAWNSNYGGGNHPGELPPEGKTVPVYFSLGNVPAGHVAISLDDGMVASSTKSGFNSRPYFHPNLNDIISVYGRYNGGCSYLGWSEYVGTVKVVENTTVNQPRGDSEMVSRDVLNVLYDWALGRQPDQGAYEHYVGNYDTNFVVDDLNRSAEHAQHMANVAAQMAEPKVITKEVIVEKPVEVIKEVPVEKIIYKEVPVGFDSLSLGELLNEAFKKLFKIK